MLHGSAQAQRIERNEAVPADVEQLDEPTATPVERNLFMTLKDGGLLMVPLFACSVLMMVFVFERAISLRRGRVIPRPFVKKFMHQLREGKLDRDQVLDLCQESQSAVSDVFAGAVRKWGRPAVEVEQAILDSGERAANGLRKYIRIFNVVSTLSPLLGLLGTVFGMIRIFSDIATADAMGRAECAGRRHQRSHDHDRRRVVGRDSGSGVLLGLRRPCRPAGHGDRRPGAGTGQPDSAEALQEDRRSLAPARRGARRCVTLDCTHAQLKTAGVSRGQPVDAIPVKSPSITLVDVADNSS